MPRKKRVYCKAVGGYGVDMYFDGLLTGLTAVEAAVVAEYNIPSNDNKLTTGDFSDLSFDGVVDFSNAGAGAYEATLVVELAVAL